MPVTRPVPVSASCIGLFVMLCDSPSLIRVSCVTMSLELSAGTWWDHGYMTEDTKCPFPRIHQLNRGRRNTSAIPEWWLTDLVFWGPTGDNLSCLDVMMVMAESWPEDSILQALPQLLALAVFLSPLLQCPLRLREGDINVLVRTGYSTALGT